MLPKESPHHSPLNGSRRTASPSSCLYLITLYELQVTFRVQLCAPGTCRSVRQERLKLSAVTVLSVPHTPVDVVTHLLYEHMLVECWCVHSRFVCMYVCMYV
jgi:hypothetical protein